MHLFRGKGIIKSKSMASPGGGKFFYPALLLNLVLIAYFIFDLYGGVTSLMAARHPEVRGADVGMEKVETTSGEKDTAGGAGLVVDWHPFGKSLDSEVVPVGTDIPDTGLNLNLRGILADETRKGGAFALIQMPGGDEKAYGVGEALTDDVKIAMIHQDRVILDRGGGRFETLKLPREPLPVRPLEE